MLENIPAGNNLIIKDKDIFDRYLNKSKHDLACYNFAGIYIWKDIFDIYWQIIEGQLCVFFKNEGGCFMNMGPLGDSFDLGVVCECFKIMDRINQNREISRIENVELSEADDYLNQGYKIVDKAGDYLYKREAIAGLRGDRFKSKRASRNYFKENYSYKLMDYSKTHKIQCLMLLDHWMRMRKKNNPDNLYNYMIDDFCKAQIVMLENAGKLGLKGIVVVVDQKVCGFSFGYQLNIDTFCILSEVADLDYQGICQYMFSAFADQLSEYEYLNVMDDSGLESLKKVKQSYRPVGEVKSFIVARNLS